MRITIISKKKNIVKRKSEKIHKKEMKRMNADRGTKHMKLQIPSTKKQTNLKSQAPNYKTCPLLFERPRSSRGSAPGLINEGASPPKSLMTCMKLAVY
jgi:hypothetical protein